MQCMGYQRSAGRLDCARVSREKCTKRNGTGNADLKPQKGGSGLYILSTRASGRYEYIYGEAIINTRSFCVTSLGKFLPCPTALVM